MGLPMYSVFCELHLAMKAQIKLRSSVLGESSALVLPATAIILSILFVLITMIACTCYVSTFVAAIVLLSRVTGVK